MKNIVLFSLSIFLFIGCKKQEQLETASITLNSIVCGTCVKNVKKEIYKIEGVKDVEVDLEKKIALVKFVPLQTNLETIEIAITDAGYDANNHKRDADAYEKLDPCCRIDG